MQPTGLDATAWLAAIVESSDDAILSKDLNGIVTSWNSGARRMFGYNDDEIVGQSILKLIPADRHHEETHILSMVRRGEHINHYNTLRRCKDGRLLNVSLSVSPIRSHDLKVLGVSTIARDITDWKVAQETQALLLRELNHRSKNLLAVADAIVRQTAKSTPASELVNRISRRLHALSINQDLLIERDWRGVEIAEIIRSQMTPVIEDFQVRVTLDGPAISVNPTIAQALGLAIFELTANALKFGALSARFGKIAIAWSITTARGPAEFELCWQETGGPPVQNPRRKGFGTTIIEDMIARSVQGQARMSYAPTGVVWTLVAPEAVLNEGQRDRV